MPLPRFFGDGLGAPSTSRLPWPAGPRHDGVFHSRAAARPLLVSAGMLGALPKLLVALLLLGARPALAGPDEERSQAVAELSALAPRIESLKREAQAGRGRPAELERLLARAQALADRLDQGGPPAIRPAAPGPDARELREQADALRDRADRLAAALGAVEERLRAARRQGELAESLDRVSGSSDPFADSAALRRSASAAAAAGPVPTATSPGSPGADRAPRPPAAGTLPAPATALPAAGPWAPPGDAPAAGLLPAEGDGPGALRHKRAALGAALAGLQAQAEALEAKARALDAGR